MLVDFDDIVIIIGHIIVKAKVMSVIKPKIEFSMSMLFYFHMQQQHNAS